MSKQHILETILIDIEEYLKDLVRNNKHKKLSLALLYFSRRDFNTNFLNILSQNISSSSKINGNLDIMKNVRDLDKVLQSEEEVKFILDFMGLHGFSNYEFCENKLMEPFL